MKISITLTYRKITQERLDIALASKDMDEDPNFAALLKHSDVVDEIGEQINRVLEDKNIEDGPFTITIEAGR